MMLSRSIGFAQEVEHSGPMCQSPIPSYKLGKFRRFRLEEVEEWLAQVWFPMLVSGLTLLAVIVAKAKRSKTAFL
jgi:hypothetical protein